ncbi:MAG: cytochrome c [Gammaproteobacteria bacterium]
MQIPFPNTVVARLCLLIVLLFAVPACADEAYDKIAAGGRLYDNWWLEYNLQKPTSTHPAYPAQGKQSGATTWRCKECHGWDYRGRDGAYRQGEHFTNIVGIQQAAGKPTTHIMATLKNRQHQYDRVMRDYGLERLALFVSRGQVDMDAYINTTDKAVVGDQRQGQTLYATHCADCHGADGRRQNFGNRDKPEYMGTIARANPWESLHKIRHGQPDAYFMGEAMPHMLGTITLEEQIHLLSYMQTLPVE